MRDRMFQLLVICKALLLFDCDKSKSLKQSPLFDIYLTSDGSKGRKTLSKSRRRSSSLSSNIFQLIWPYLNWRKRITTVHASCSNFSRLKSHAILTERMRSRNHCRPHQSILCYGRIIIVVRCSNTPRSTCTTKVSDPGIRYS